MNCEIIVLLSLIQIYQHLLPVPNQRIFTTDRANQRRRLNQRTFPHPETRNQYTFPSPAKNRQTGAPRGTGFSKSREPAKR